MSKRGFTIIELIVVVAIIAILASIVMVNVNGNLAKARSARRKTELRSLQQALTAYYADYGSYPSTNGYWCSSEPNDLVTGCGGPGGEYIPGLTPTYIDSLPRDTQGGDSTNPACVGGWKRAFLYVSDGINYKLLSHCSIETSWDYSDPMFDCLRPTWALMVCSGDPDVCGVVDPNNPPRCLNGTAW